MKHRSILCALLLSAAIGVGTAGVAVAAHYPDRPIRFVVPFPPGGNTDWLARTIGHRLSAVLGQSVVIDNRPGAGGSIGTAIVAKAPADGYTILLGTIGSISIAPNLYSHPPYNPERDLAPITLVSSNPLVVITNPTLPAHTLKELVALAKTRRLTYGSGGTGTSTNLAVVLFQRDAGIHMTQVPYRGAPLALTALMGDQVNLMFDNITPELPQIRAGKVRALAVTGRSRSPALPNVPTVAESGWKHYDVESWYGVLAPAGTPAARIRLLNHDIVSILKSEHISTLLRAQGATPIGSSPEAFASFIRSELAKWGAAVKAAGVRVD